MENQVPEYTIMLEQMLLPTSPRFIKLVGMIVDSEEAACCWPCPGSRPSSPRKWEGRWISSMK